jgi:transposase
MKTHHFSNNTSAQVALLEAENQVLKEQLAQVQEQVVWWEEQYKLARQRSFGKSSEKNLGQFDLFDEIEKPAIEENNDNPADTETITYTRNKKTKGRNIDTTKLPREICVHALSDEEKQCQGCGTSMQQIGEDKIEKLIYVPAIIKVLEHVYPKFACRACETIKMPKKEEGPILKSMATSSLIAEIIISKYERHIPLYRRSQMFARDGIDIPDNTLGNWVMQACEVLSPLREVLWEQINQSHYLQVDETPVKVLDEDKKGYMWCYHNPDSSNRFVLFDYHLSRGSQVPTARLQNFQGVLQTDGYSGYNTLRNRDGVINMGCFAHCRRKFNDALQVAGATTQGLAAKAIQFIGKLYRIETAIKTYSLEAKKAYRQEHAKPVLHEFFAWLTEKKTNVLPKSQLGNAFTYAINQWSQLSIYIEHGEVNIDNNWVENQIRPFALGRRNWLCVSRRRIHDENIMKAA